MNENGGIVADLEIIKGIERLDVKVSELLRRGDDHEARLRVLEQRDDPSEEHGKQLVDHENRIRSGELWRWKATGAILAAGILGGGAGQALQAVMGAG
jgi:hypothetical protein